MTTRTWIVSNQKILEDKRMKFLKMVVAAIVAVGMACVAIAHDASDNAVVVTFFATAIAVAAVLGAFDMPAKDAKHMSLKDGARSYGEAA